MFLVALVAQEAQNCNQYFPKSTVLSIFCIVLLLNKLCLQMMKKDSPHVVLHKMLVLRCDDDVQFAVLVCLLPVQEYINRFIKSMQLLSYNYLWLASITRYVLYHFIRIKILLYKFVIINKMLK